MGICPSCHTQNTLAGGAPGAQPGGAPQQYGMPNMGAASGGGFPVGRAIAGVGGAILIGVLSIGGWYVKSYFFGGGGKGKIGYGQLGIDKSKADGDKMISSVSGLAKKWKKDAVWWSVNYQAVRGDGTVVLDKGAQVEYISPSKVQSASKKLREDSIKKFQFSTVGVNFSKNGTPPTSGRTWSPRRRPLAPSSRSWRPWPPRGSRATRPYA